VNFANELNAVVEQLLAHGGYDSVAQDLRAIAVEIADEELQQYSAGVVVDVLTDYGYPPPSDAHPRLVAAGAALMRRLSLDGWYRVPMDADPRKYAVLRPDELAQIAGGQVDFVAYAPPNGVPQVAWVPGMSRERVLARLQAIVESMTSPPVAHIGGPA
jgi:hypothetical protein